MVTNTRLLCSDKCRDCSAFKGVWEASPQAFVLSSLVQFYTRCYWIVLYYIENAAMFSPYFHLGIEIFPVEDFNSRRQCSHAVCLANCSWSQFPRNQIFIELLPYIFFRAGRKARRCSVPTTHHRGGSSRPGKVKESLARLKLKPRSLGYSSIH